MPSSTYSIITFSATALPKEYLGLVFSKWLKSLRYGNELYKLIEPQAYWPIYHKYLEKIMGAQDAIVRLAVLTDDKDVVLGFSVSRGIILDYVYVHRDHRALGIGSHLIPKDIKHFTHVTKMGILLWRQKYRSWTFNPFI